MSEAKPVVGTPMPKHVAAFIGSVLNSGADPILRAQADLLVSFETAMADWLRRRHEAVIDTQNLLTRLRASLDPGEQGRRSRTGCSMKCAASPPTPSAARRSPSN